MDAALIILFRSWFMLSERCASYDAMESAIRSSSDADAVREMALEAAEGINVPRNWVTALDHLQRAAELGSFLAQAELAGLSGNWSLAQAVLREEPVTQSWWPRLRSSIDLAQWLTASCSSATVSEAPRMVIVSDLATPEICDWLIARARPRLERAKGYGDGEEKLEVHDERTNSACAFSGPDRDLFMVILRARIAAATQMRVREMEPLQVLHYSVGQEFHRHYDTPADPNARGIPHRLITLLLSLNEDYEGGETEFPITGGRWRGRKGIAIYFWNTMADGARDKRTLHAGLPVTRGEKWLMSQFIDRPKKA
jgi:prolyl 4-hydroxylase